MLRRMLRFVRYYVFELFIVLSMVFFVNLSSLSISLAGNPHRKLEFFVSDYGAYSTCSSVKNRFYAVLGVINF